jgi:hypothetical protein
MSEGQQPTSRPISEEALLQHIRALAKRTGWLTYHTHDSRRSEDGWPDLVLCDGKRLIIAELKSATGKLTPEQMSWLALLAHTGKVECYVWRPTDWEGIVAILQGQPSPLPEGAGAWPNAGQESG